MLILTRRPAEAIRVGEEVTITLLGIRGNQVRIGIDAPRSIPVHREEIYDRIQADARRDQSSSQELAHRPNLQVVSSNGETTEGVRTADQAAKEFP